MTTAYIQLTHQQTRHRILAPCDSGMGAPGGGVKIDSFLEAESSATKVQEKRKITELLESIQPKSTLIVTDLSRLGRNMLEVINLIEEINDKGIRIVFVHQQGLEAAKAKGVRLGQSNGSRNKTRKADPCREQISHLFDAGVNVANIQKIIQAGGAEISCTALEHYIKNEFQKEPTS